MILYIDISEFLRTRFTTGIQRVIKEFLVRALDDKKLILKVVYYDISLKSWQHLPNSEVAFFLGNIKNYKLPDTISIELSSINNTKQIWFDLDAAWNSPIPRDILYKELQQSNFQIVNFIYDLIPILFPTLVRDITRENFSRYINAAKKYSHKIYFDSMSAQNDFQPIQDSGVVYLGANFQKFKTNIDQKYKNILSKKYILFVSTIEPRKQHQKVLNAFTLLSKQHPDLNLVFIGRVGWKVDTFMETITSHPLKDKSFFHYTNIDDEMLGHFYKNAFIVTYLSDYEGYGLPVAESLGYGNVTITSDNSSLLEVGKDFADYIEDNNTFRLLKTINLYLKDEQRYKDKKQYIAKNYKARTWDQFYDELF